ncbi:flagellar hook-length control protein FliK [Paenibacillus sp. UNC499MF]|uniref:flagellar hook-length control protein FliK n=1 Tax=Paenibacillus sp. UNC499MF TaxID=1502751 RepID=UPI00089FB3F7|nr:flagellar hook-length control protein FliK [Paenibacillus sp. UNC499MF]SEF57284.1 hypothetical protein SAMN02799616_00518 [Paenibacillus sp. UNC499MF]
MNISGLIRGLAGGMQAAEPKTLELKPGQVVKGVVLQVYDNQEAQMSIDGVQVRAKLETPLAPGQTAWLQVQPESTGGQVVLKPAAGPAVPATQEEIGQMLKQTGLKDTAVNRELVQMMKQQGIPLTKEAAAPLQEIMSRIPASVKPEQWVQAVGVAIGKGLPLTPDTVGAVHQALFGKPFGETLQNLAQTLSGLLQNGGLAEGTNGGGEKLLRQLADVLRTMQDTAAGVGGKPAGNGAAAGAESGTGKPGPAAVTSPANGGAGTAGESAVRQPVGTRPDGGNTQAAGQGRLVPPGTSGLPQPAAGAPADGGGRLTPPASGMQADAAAELPGAGRPSPGTQPQQPAGGMPAGQIAAPAGGGTAAAAPGVPAGGPAELTPAAGRPAAGAPAPPPGTAAASGAAAGGARPDAAGAQPQSAQPASAPRAADTHAAQAAAASRGGAAEADGARVAAAGEQRPAAGGGWVRELLRAVGVDHESRLLRQPGSAPHAGGAHMAAAGEGQAAALKADGAETLKSLLLQLTAADDLPAPIRETAQQALQQITGQQLLLSPDRSGVFTHVTLFVPLLGADGQPTAAVHIQSRKGRRGELDAENCRLLFDLQMKSMGHTLVDVGVMNKMVSLQVFNDDPIIGELLSGSKEEIAAALDNLGYQFLSMKTGEYPKSLGSLSGGDSGSPLSAVMMDTIVPGEAYRGVDLRV